MNLYDVAREATDNVLGEGTYALVNKNNPDPEIQRCLNRRDMTQPGVPQIVRTAPAAQSAPQTRIVMLETDQLLCSDLLSAGYPQAMVMEIATALAEKVEYLREIESYKTQNRDLLAANQRLLTRAETAESELRRAKQGTMTK